MSDKETPASGDIALVHSPTEDGEGARILRLRKGTVQSAEVRPVREGQPLNEHELVKLHPRQDTPRICDVEVLYEPDTSPDEATCGPSRVSNKAYRENWERIFASGSSSPRKRSKDDISLN
jgi:hypothetical protein